jgi:hypothetical protein
MRIQPPSCEASVNGQPATKGNHDMSKVTSGQIPAFGKTGSPKDPSITARCPRRVVLLRDDEHSAVAEILLEMQGADVSGKRLHAELQRLASEHPGVLVAAEWLGPLGWTRFLWCRK